MKKPSLNQSISSNLLFILIFFSASLSSKSAIGQSEIDCRANEGYVAPPYKAPSKEPSKSESNLIDNGDGTITDNRTGLMWTQKDSYGTLNKCLNWLDSKEYVENLHTGGYNDWRMPTIKELISIYDPTRENVLAWDKDPDNPLRLDEKFDSGAAYWYWSSDCGQTEMTKCCGKTLYFPKGLVHLRRFEMCNNGGVRAVRNIN